jgi:hypothetical protein
VSFWLWLLCVKAEGETQELNSPDHAHVDSCKFQSNNFYYQSRWRWHAWAIVALIHADQQVMQASRTRPHWESALGFADAEVVFLPFECVCRPSLQLRMRFAVHCSMRRSMASRHVTCEYGKRDWVILSQTER